MLFIPGNTPNLLMNADVLGADSIILDLEDAVSPAEKDAARILVRNAMTFLDFSRVETIVRINSVDTPFWKKDLDTILPLKPTLIMPPKTSAAQDVLTVDAYMSQLEDKLGMARNTVRLIPLIETALGLENAFQIAAASSRVAALFLGAEDLTADLRCKRTKEGEEIAYARARMVAAARAAGVDVYDTPFTDVNDDEGIRVDAEIIERFAGLDRAQGEELGLEVSVKAAQAAAPYADGFYLMTPFNRIALMERLIARLKDEGIAD